MSDISVTKEGSTSQRNSLLIINTAETLLPLIEIIEETYEEGSDRYTYVETDFDSHECEWVSLYRNNTYVVNRFYDHQPPIDDGIIYEDKAIYPNSWRHHFDTRICMILVAPHDDENRDLYLMYRHLIDWG